MTPPVALTIAGSDSGGAAGLQADLKTFAALGVYGVCAVTVVTAQNSLAVWQLHSLSPNFVAAQLTAVLDDYQPTVAKTGFIGSVETIVAIAQTLKEYDLRHIIVDPVLVNHRGEAMFPPDVTEAYCQHLLPIATLVTPNRAEATLLTGSPVESWTEMAEAAHTLCDLGAQRILMKGLRDENTIGDLFFDGDERIRLSAPWIDTPNTHGSGDTLSAAIIAYLARDEEIATAIQQAHAFTHRAIQRGAEWELGAGHGPVASFHSFWPS